MDPYNGGQNDEHIQNRENTLQKDLIEELKRIQAAKDAKQAGKDAKKVKISESVAPVLQDPLIYNRFLNHPEFVFPTYFKSKRVGVNEQTMSMNQLIAEKMKKFRARAAAAKN